MAVSPDDVRRILPDTELSDAELQREIDAGRRMFLQRTSGGQGITATRKDDVVERLAAHLISVGAERQIDSASESGGNVSFAGETGEGLRATTHGQAAIALDPTDRLETEHIIINDGSKTNPKNSR
jgi:hypothetical protein